MNHFVKKGDVRKRPQQETPQAAPKPVVRRAASFEDIQKQFSSWTHDMRIPGKVQAWFTAEAKPENSDWKIYNKLINGHESLLLDAPAKGMDTPEVVTQIFEQIKKEHLRNFRKAIRTIWFRACGNGNFALVVQANLRGKNSAHECKTFVDFLERSCPEVISCHQIQCQPFVPFDPSIHQSTRIESRCNFGKDFMPLGDSGFCMHVLDWAPRIKDAWLKLSEKIAGAIHPAKGDKFFEFYSGSSFVAATLSPLFAQVESLDCRETSMESSRPGISPQVLFQVRQRRALDLLFQPARRGALTGRVCRNNRRSQARAHLDRNRRPGTGPKTHQAVQEPGVRAPQDHPPLSGAWPREIRDFVHFRAGSGGVTWRKKAKTSPKSHKTRP